MNDLVTIEPDVAVGDFDQPTPVAVSDETPRVTGVVPERARAGIPVTISGSNFFTNSRAEVQAVTFEGGPSLNFRVVDPSTIEAVVPPTAITGAVTVTRVPGNGGPPLTSAPGPVFFAIPTITSISPLSGLAAEPPNGTTVRISGTGLGRDVTDRPEVRFNGALATQITDFRPPFSSGATQIAVTLPLDATDGPVTVKTRGGMTSSREAGLPDFDVLLAPPVIDRITDERGTTIVEGAAGTKIVIVGKRFGVNGGLLKRISFEPEGARVPADKTDARNTNQMLFTSVPEGAVTGFIRVDRTDSPTPAFSPMRFKVRAKLEAPSNLTAMAMGATIRLSWVDNSSFELGFAIERRDPVNGYMEVGRVEANRTTFDDRPPAANVLYTYRVRAFDATGVSVASNEASARTGGAGTTTFTDFNPKSGAIGTSVNISGSNLGNVVAIQFSAQFGFVNAPFVIVSQVSINTQVPAGTITGPIVLVLNEGQRLPSPVSFTVGGTTSDLAAPTNLTGTAVSGSQIDLTWQDNSQNEDGFIIERGPGAGTSFTQIASVPMNTRRYSDTTVSAGTLYTYRVKAFNATRQSGYSNTVRIGTPLPGLEFTPNAPSNLAATASGAAINLTWVDNSAVETGFRLERKMGTFEVFAPYAMLAANATSFVDTSVTPGNTYFYRILAYNQNGESAFSNAASATVQQGGGGGGGGGDVPAAPSNLTAVGEIFAVSLTWNDSSINEGGFRIERQIGGGAWSQIAEVPANSRAYTDSPLSPNNVYTYRVSAFNTAGVSSPSNTASARPTRIFFGL